MSRKQNRKKQHAPGIWRLTGIVIALLVLCGALLDTREYVFPVLNAEAEETPKLAHYVNRMDEARDGNVHIDLETGKEPFAFDLQAYIPPEAEKLVITETLNPVFSFVNADSVYRWQFQSSDPFGQNPPLSATEVFLTSCQPVVSVDRTTDSTRETLTVELDLGALSAEEKTQVRGKWFRIGFDVRLKEMYALDAEMLDFVFLNYSNTAPVTTNEPVLDAPEEPHSGLTAQASYTVETAMGNLEQVYSNIVTIARASKAESVTRETTEETTGETTEETTEETTAAADAGITEQEPKTRSVTLKTAGANNTASAGSTKEGKKTAEGTTQDGAADGNSGDESKESEASKLRSTNGTSQTQDAFTIDGLISFYGVPEKGLPDSLTITVYADGKERVSFEFNGSSVARVIGDNIGPGCTVDTTANRNAWGFTITGLEEKTPEGKAIEYTIKETGRPDGYLVTYAGENGVADAKNRYVIFNSYSEQQASEDAANKKKDEENKEETEPLADGKVALLINGEANDVVLKQRDDLFTYTIEAVVPKGAKTFTITNTLDPVLKLHSKETEIAVTANGTAVPASGDVGGTTLQTVIVDGQNLTVNLPDAETHEEEKISVRFDAIIRSDMDVSSFAATGGEIPNNAKMEATDGASQITHAVSPVRYVKMPDESGVKKTVNDSENYVMEAAGDELAYTITARIPLDAATYTLVDTVSQVIEVKSVSAKIGSKEVASSAITTRGQEVSLKLDDAYNHAGETITMTVKARIVDGADLSLFNNYKVPNTATVFVNGRLYETSEPATVDGSVLGVRRRRGNVRGNVVRGGPTGEKRLIVDIGVGAAALVALVLLLRRRVDF